MTRKKFDWKRAGAMTAMAITLITAGWWLGREQATLKAGDGSAALAEASENSRNEREQQPEALADKPRGSSTFQSGSSNVPVEQPLPDLSIPFADVIEELKARADRGDARAACRLATEATYCRGEVKPQQIRTDEQIAEDLSRRPDSATNDKTLINIALRIRDETTGKLTHCKGVDQAIAQRAPFYQLQAANAGHIRSMMAIATPPWDTVAEDMIADPSLAHLYQQNMLPMFLRALQSGEVSAVFWWHSIVSMGAMSPLRGRLPDHMRNPAVTQVLYGRVLGELTGDPRFSALDARPAAATADDIAEANDFYDRFFRDSPRFKAQKEQARAQRARDPDGNGVIPTDKRRECDSGWESDYDT